MILSNNGSRRDLSEEERRYLFDVKLRHSGKSSRAALLTELRIGDEASELFNAAECLGRLGGTRVVRRLSVLAKDLSAQLPMPEEEWGGELPGRKRLESIFWALGRIDTDEAQGVLAELLQTSPNPIIRADVMEYMAYGSNFDPELVLPFASQNYSTPEILSALYAMYCRHYRYRPDEVREKLMPLMDHPYPHVQGYLIELFSYNEAHREFLISLKTHTSERIRNLVEEALSER